MTKKRTFKLTLRSDGYVIDFDAMASACQVLIDSNDHTLTNQIAQTVTTEVWRIEDKFSRYNASSLCSKINNSNGCPVAIDHETFLLLTFAQQCFDLSGGLFDISSGVLRNIWRFDTSNNIPTEQQVSDILPLVDWPKIKVEQASITIPSMMEVDFGGIGKEYAVDRALLLCGELTKVPLLVNLGGDLCASAPRHNDQPWQVGIEHPGFVDKQVVVVSLYHGALATSGDAKRFLLREGKRYSHILNAQTGWPIEQAPASVTVASERCVEAGVMATLAMLQGADAEHFLTEQQVKHWVVRHPKIEN